MRIATNGVFLETANITFLHPVHISDWFARKREAIMITAFVCGVSGIGGMRDSVKRNRCNVDDELFPWFSKIILLTFVTFFFYLRRYFIPKNG